MTTLAARADRPSLVPDLVSGLVVFLVAVPLCLGIALASGAPLFSGLVSGVIGGIVVGALSGSHVSVSGPAAGLAAIVLAQINGLGSFQTFLLAVLIAGAMQLAFGLAKAGVLAKYFPTNVIKGLLAAIGVLLILKQIPTSSATTRTGKVTCPSCRPMATTPSRHSSTRFRPSCPGLRSLARWP